MKTLKLFLILFLFPFFLSAEYKTEITIVESVPEETVYGSSMTLRTLEVWLEMIKSAQKNIDFEEFYITNESGEPLEQVVNLIKEKAASGVKMRFIFEKAMFSSSEKSIETLKGENIEIAIIDFGKKKGGVQHSKFFIVDGREVFIGSQNFDWRSLSQIHELGVRIKSEKAAAAFGKIFEIDWALAGKSVTESIYKNAKLNFKKLEKAMLNGSEIEYYPAFSPKSLLPEGFKAEIDELISLIKSAKKSIKAQVMTFAPQPKKWKELTQALISAAKKGVSIELILADWSMGGKYDKEIKKLSKEKNISIKISSIPPHSRGFIPFSRVQHCKYILIDDDKAMISTSNWGYDYFYKSRGAAIILKGKAAGNIILDIFSRSWTAPYANPLDVEKEYKRPKRS
ncbi:MAG: hypothetical protein K6357_06865 [Elusimicrobiota bacterium]